MTKDEALIEIERLRASIASAASLQPDKTKPHHVSVTEGFKRLAEIKNQFKDDPEISAAILDVGKVAPDRPSGPAPHPVEK